MTKRPHSRYVPFQTLHGHWSRIMSTVTGAGGRAIAAISVDLSAVWFDWPIRYVRGAAMSGVSSSHPHSICKLVASAAAAQSRELHNDRPTERSTYQLSCMSGQNMHFAI